MYLPKHFNETDYAVVMALVNTYPFATLVTVKDGVPLASHIPFLVEEGESLRLLCHLAKANEQAEHLAAGDEKAHAIADLMASRLG